MITGIHESPLSVGSGMHLLTRKEGRKKMIDCIFCNEEEEEEEEKIVLVMKPADLLTDWAVVWCGGFISRVSVC